MRTAPATSSDRGAHPVRARLILKLFELRRDPVLREARQWFLADLHPESFAELLRVVTDPRNASVRMVIGYWDMAASLVTFGAVDAEMFRAANTEMVAVFARIEPFLEEWRAAAGIPEFAAHIEAVVRAMPGAAERTALLREQFRAMAAHRSTS